MKRRYAIGSKVWNILGERGIVMDAREIEFIFRNSRVEYIEYLVAWRTDTWRTSHRWALAWADRYDGHMVWVDESMISQSHASLKQHEDEPDYDEEYE